MKESEKIDKYLDLSRERKKLLKMKVTVIPVVVGTLGMVSKDQENRLGELDLRGRLETTQTTAQEYLEESCKHGKTCCHSDSRGKPPVKTD